MESTEETPHLSTEYLRTALAYALAALPKNDDNRELLRVYVTARGRFLRVVGHDCSRVHTAHVPLPVGVHVHDVVLQRADAERVLGQLELALENALTSKVFPESRLRWRLDFGECEPQILELGQASPELDLYEPPGFNDGEPVAMPIEAKVLQQAVSLKGAKLVCVNHVRTDAKGWLHLSIGSEDLGDHARAILLPWSPPEEDDSARGKSKRRDQAEADDPRQEWIPGTQPHETVTIELSGSVISLQNAIKANKSKSKSKRGES